MAEHIERKTDETGRRLEIRTTEREENGKKERIIETWAEEIPLVLIERIVEEITPIVTIRTKEIYQKGIVSDTIIEELDHGTLKMSLPQTITGMPPLPQAIPVESKDITKEDLLNALKSIPPPQSEGVTRKELLEILKNVQKPQPEGVTREELLEVIKSLRQPQEEMISKSDLLKELRRPRKKLRIEVPDEEEKPKEDSSIWAWIETVGYIILAGQLAFCIYHLVLRNWL